MLVIPLSFADCPSVCLHLYLSIYIFVPLLSTSLTRCSTDCCFEGSRCPDQTLIRQETNCVHEVKIAEGHQFRVPVQLGCLRSASSPAVQNRDEATLGGILLLSEHRSVEARKTIMVGKWPYIAENWPSMLAFHKLKSLKRVPQHNLQSCHL